MVTTFRTPTICHPPPQDGTSGRRSSLPSSPGSQSMLGPGCFGDLAQPAGYLGVVKRAGADEFPSSDRSDRGSELAAA